ncbi:MAG: MFS transporter [Candidatus Hodarchaeota archaeon]
MLKEDMEISKGDFFRLFISYSLNVYITISLSIDFYYRIFIFYNAPSWATFAAFIGFVCGCCLTGFLLDKNVPIRLFWFLWIILSIVTYVSSFLLDAYSKEVAVIILFFVGIFVGIPWVPSGALVRELTTIEERGRVAGLLNLLGGIICLVITVSLIFIDIYQQFQLFATLFLITGILNIIFNKNLKTKITRYEIQVIEENKRRNVFLNCLIGFAICFLWGFIALNVNWGAFNAFALQAGHSLFGDGVSLIGPDLVFFFFSIDFIAVSFILGLISDKLGRKIIWVIAVTAIIFALFVFASFQNPFFINFLSICLGISLPAALIGMLNFVSDSTSLKEIGKYFGIFFGIGWGGGLALGQLVGSLFLSYPITNFALVAVFIAIIGILSIISIQETLPPKKERRWFDKLDHIYVISQGGIPLYNFSFKPHVQDPSLIAGGITGFCEFIKELTMSESRLKVVKQERAIVLIDYGEHVTTALIASEELKILRNKLEFFTQEFEEFFQDVLKEWVGEVTVFLPTKTLVERIFEVKKFKPILRKSA